MGEGCFKETVKCDISRRDGKMIKRKIIYVITVILHVLILISLFLPAIKDYNVTSSIMGKVYDTLSSGDKTYIFTYAVYYIPIIISGIVIALLDNRVKYVFGVISSTLGLALSLYMFIFPAMGNNYLFATYQFGIYTLLLLQVTTILLCSIGISLKNIEDINPIEDDKAVDAKSFTTEIPVSKIISKL